MISDVVAVRGSGTRFEQRGRIEMAHSQCGKIIDQSQGVGKAEMRAELQTVRNQRAVAKITRGEAVECFRVIGLQLSR